MGLFDKKGSGNDSLNKLGSLLKQAFPDTEFMKDEGGSFHWREDSIALSIFINNNFGDGTNVVSVVALTLFGARDQDSLYRHLMTQTSDVSIFARWETEPGEQPGTVDIMLTQNLMLDTLDVSELAVAVSGVAESANTNDEPLQKLFGGQRCADKFQWQE